MLLEVDFISSFEVYFVIASLFSIILFIYLVSNSSELNETQSENVLDQESQVGSFISSSDGPDEEKDEKDKERKKNKKYDIEGLVDAAAFIACLGTVVGVLAVSVYYYILIS